MKISITVLLSCLIVLAATLQQTESKCVNHEPDICYDETNKKERLIGDVFKEGCSTCTCEKSKNKLVRKFAFINDKNFN